MIEKEFDQMLEDLNSVNDEFIGDYFNDVEDTVKEENPEELNEEPVEEVASEEDKEEESEVEEKEEKEKPQEYQNHFTSFSKTNINKIGSKRIKVYHQNNFEKEEKEEPKKTFSYSEILNRLDQEKKYDLNNVNDLMKFIDKCETSEQFFDYVESERNDK